MIFSFQTIAIFYLLSFITYGPCEGFSTKRQVETTHNWSKEAAFIPTRRTIIASISGGLAIVPALEPCIAESPVNPVEAVRRSAANIPGYGQTDVFYPPSFAGNWKAVREILPTTGSGNGATLKLEYPVRFIKSIEDDAVVADRGWNQANLEKAIKQLSAKGESAAVPTYHWIETNPNDLRMTFSDGSKKEIKLTKRATEKTDDTVFSSEFQRVTQDDTRGVPMITARRVLNKWKVLEPSMIEGIEIVYDVGGGDPLVGPTGTEHNKVLSKSRLRLERNEK